MSDDAVKANLVLRLRSAVSGARRDAASYSIGARPLAEPGGVRSCPERASSLISVTCGLVGISRYYVQTYSSCVV